MTKLPLLLSVSCIAGLLCACSDTGVCDSFESSFAIKNQAGQPANVFALGEPMTFENRATNHSNLSKTLLLTGGCSEAYFAVADDSADVWVSTCGGAGTLCLCISPVVTFAPFETKEFVVVWDQKDPRIDQQVPVGSYSAAAYDGTECSPAMDKAQQITIQ